jgi:hypothetical protein
MSRWVVLRNRRKKINGKA